MTSADLITRIDAGEFVTSGDWDEEPTPIVEYQPTTLILREDLPFDEWLSIGDTLKRIQKGVQWWIGEWLRFGERKYGEMYTQALEATGYDYGTLRNFKYVADNVDLSLRNDNVPFSYYALVASLPPTIQAQVLDKVETEQLTWREVRAEVREIKQDIETYPMSNNGLDHIETDKLIPHVTYNSGNNEWYTPPEYIEAARAVMGKIELDPASSDVANLTVQADSHYTIETDGLLHDWAGKVWMNPPYAGELIGKFCQKLARHFLAGDIEQAVVLVNNATETAWFQGMLSLCSAVCFPKSRVRFLTDKGSTGAPLQGQAVLFFTNDTDAIARFASCFRQFGEVCKPEA